MALFTQQLASPDWSLPVAIDWISEVLLSERTASFSLLLELRSGNIIAAEIDRHTGVRTETPVEHWLDVDQLEIKGRVTSRSAPEQGAGGRHRAMVVSSADVQRIWRTTDDPARLPELMSPVGDGNMSLYSVASWIATEGGTANFHPSQPPDWGLAYKSIIDAASSGSVQVYGKRKGKFKAIPARRFIEIAVEYPNTAFNAELWDGEEMFLRSVEYLDDFLWRKGGFCDELVRQKETMWSHLLIPKADVRLRWPYDARAAPGPVGRPSSQKIVLGEFVRRSNAGQLPQTLRAQAIALATWLKEQHPDAPPAGPKAIEHMLRAPFKLAQKL